MRAVQPAVLAAIPDSTYAGKLALRPGHGMIIEVKAFRLLPEPANTDREGDEDADQGQNAKPQSPKLPRRGCGRRRRRYVPPAAAAGRHRAGGAARAAFAVGAAAECACCGGRDRRAGNAGERQAARPAPISWSTSSRRSTSNICRPIRPRAVRGIHESLINYGKNTMPEFLTCMHEESAVGMCHGYFKATGKPLMTLVHGVVGLQHATMAVYNAWCDRVPVLVLGGNDLDAAHRAPGVPTFHSGAGHQCDRARLHQMGRQSGVAAAFRARASCACTRSRRRRLTAR